MANNYYPFGLSFNSYQRVTSKQNDYLYNGKELQDELGLNWLDYGARMYDPSLARFFAIDPLAFIFQSYSAYQYELNNPIRFEDWEGKGPGDRVKIAKSYVGTPYSMAGGINISYEQRTGLLLFGNGLNHLDCSEFVYRVLEADGLLTNNGGTTGCLLGTFEKNEAWIKSNSPEIGDVFLWRKGEKGHTGIVTGVITDEDGNIVSVEITHAKGSDYGTITEIQPISYFLNHWGWKGFFRPVEEFRPEKIEKKEGETAEEWLERAKNNVLHWQKQRRLSKN